MLQRAGSTLHEVGDGHCYNFSHSSTDKGQKVIHMASWLQVGTSDDTMTPRWKDYDWHPGIGHLKTLQIAEYKHHSPTQEALCGQSGSEPIHA